MKVLEPKFITAISSYAPFQRFAKETAKSQDNSRFVITKEKTKEYADILSDFCKENGITEIICPYTPGSGDTVLVIPGVKVTFDDPIVFVEEPSEEDFTTEEDILRELKANNIAGIDYSHLETENICTVRTDFGCSEDHHVGVIHKNLGEAIRYILKEIKEDNWTLSNIIESELYIEELNFWDGN